MFGFLRQRTTRPGAPPPPQGAAEPRRAQDIAAEPRRPTDTARPRLPQDLMRKVRRIEIATNRLVDQGVAGDYHSVFKGRGMEFEEVRPYQPGDDVRTLDWNVTARMGSPFVKKYVEERDLTVFVVVDVSGSLSFGSRAILKRELAAEIAALLAFAAVRNQDRVGAALVSDRLELFLPPRRRRNQVLRLVRELLERPARGATDLDRGLGAVLANLKRRAVLFVISDFIGGSGSRALKAAAARHDLILIEIADPRDQELPAVGPVVLRDAETGRTALVDGRRLGRDHRERRRRERDSLARLTRRLGVDRLELRTDRPYLAAVLSFFEQRRRRLAR
ncbi:MAG TPA: DUF58 domain-containing protein [Thermoanaerobaculia bacterium]|nr:DUF58 domain-containing protein [Thermoanaerobaculia bacterium]